MSSSILVDSRIPSLNHSGRRNQRITQQEKLVLRLLVIYLKQNLDKHPVIMRLVMIIK